MSFRSKLLTVAIVVMYAIAMISTNGMYTFLDDESTIVCVAGNPVVPTLQLYLHGDSNNEHPPASDILLHGWMVATGYSLFWLRIFANLFYILGSLFVALAARRLRGDKAYWMALILALTWPFAFQYGRITGWYCCSYFLVALATWLYLKLLDGCGWLWWAAFTLTAIAMVWTNYFGVATLLLLLFDLLVFYLELARRRVVLLAACALITGLSFVPLLRVVIGNLGMHAVGVHSALDLKSAVAQVGFPVFALFGSVAVAPWFWPLSVPVALAAIAILISVWCSTGRRWLIYTAISVALLALSGHADVKRILFLLPWLFIAMVLSALPFASYPGLARIALFVLVSAGWAGIVSGRHYATSNLYEPWKEVAQWAAIDARQGATIVSDSYPFFFYLNYDLGLERETKTATGPDLTSEIYQAHGYRIFEPDGEEEWLEALNGKVVLVSGASSQDEVQWMAELNDRLRQKCRVTGRFRAAPDPALALKTRFVKDAPALPDRVQATWFDCSAQIH